MQMFCIPRVAVGCLRWRFCVSFAKKRKKTNKNEESLYINGLPGMWAGTGPAAQKQLKQMIWGLKSN